MKMISRLIIAILAGLSLFGCKPYKVAQRETVIKDSLYITQRMIDRVLIRDSVYERNVHDTVYKYKERETVRYISLRDTLYIEKRDSVSVPYPLSIMVNGERVKLTRKATINYCLERLQKNA